MIVGTKFRQRSSQEELRECTPKKPDDDPIKEKATFGGQPPLALKKKPRKSFWSNLFGSPPEIRANPSIPSTSKQVDLNKTTASKSPSPSAPPLTDSSISSASSLVATSSTLPARATPTPSISASSSSSSSESINTIRSSKSFSFMSPKGYRKGNKKIPKKGKRVPIEELEACSSPTGLPKSPLKPKRKVSTLSKLGMKIGLKSKYNLQSCESLNQPLSEGSEFDWTNSPLVYVPPNKIEAKPVELSPKPEEGTLTLRKKRKAPPPPPAQSNMNTGRSLQIHLYSVRDETGAEKNPFLLEEVKEGSKPTEFTPKKRTHLGGWCSDGNLKNEDALNPFLEPDPSPSTSPSSSTPPKEFNGTGISPPTALLTANEIEVNAPVKKEPVLQKTECDKIKKSPLTPNPEPKTTKEPEISNILPTCTKEKNENPALKAKLETQPLKGAKVSPSVSNITPLPVITTTPKPWYKRSSSKKTNSLSAPKPTICILPKFSDLDREACKIVEEKKQKEKIKSLYEASLVHPEGATALPKEEEVEEEEEKQKSHKELISIFNSSFKRLDNGVVKEVRTSQGKSSKDKNPISSLSPTDLKTIAQNYQNPPQGSKTPAPLEVPIPKTVTSLETPQKSTSEIENNKKATKSSESTSEVGEQPPPKAKSPEKNEKSDKFNESQSPRAESLSIRWNCQRCTLSNASWRILCEACFQKRGVTLEEMPQIPETSRETVLEKRKSPPKSRELLKEKEDNFLSHLPTKETHEKGKVFTPTDPEMEEIDIAKLREARMAYFSRNLKDSEPKEPKNDLSNIERKEMNNESPLKSPGHIALEDSPFRPMLESLLEANDLLYEELQKRANAKSPQTSEFIQMHTREASCPARNNINSISGRGKSPEEMNNMPLYGNIGRRRSYEFEEEYLRRWNNPPMENSIPLGFGGESSYPEGLGYAGACENTLAVNKLLKKLQIAIAQGDHRLAASLAHDLALLKVNCIVSKNPKPTIRVFVEDRFLQQGPFQVQLNGLITLKDLKEKIESDWGIPTTFQKWILGQKMTESDSQLLAEFDIQDDSMAFLYIVTPQIDNDQPKSASLNPRKEKKGLNLQNGESSFLKKRGPGQVTPKKQRSLESNEETLGSSSSPSRIDEFQTPKVVKNGKSSAIRSKKFEKSVKEEVSNDKIVQNHEAEKILPKKPEKEVTPAKIEDRKTTDVVKNQTNPSRSEEKTLPIRKDEEIQLKKTPEIIQGPSQAKDKSPDQALKGPSSISSISNESSNLTKDQKQSAQNPQEEKKPQSRKSSPQKNPRTQIPILQKETKEDGPIKPKRKVPVTKVDQGTETERILRPLQAVQPVQSVQQAQTEESIITPSTSSNNPLPSVIPASGVRPSQPSTSASGNNGNIASKTSKPAKASVETQIYKVEVVQNSPEVQRLFENLEKRQFSPPPALKEVYEVNKLEEEPEFEDLSGIKPILIPESEVTIKAGTPSNDQKDGYLQLMEIMEKEDLIRNTEPFECYVCLTLINAGEGVMLRDCLHTFCQECLSGTIQYADEPDVKCPFKNESYSCSSSIQEREIKALLLPELFEKYLAKSVKLAENKALNSYHCKTLNCPGWCLFEPEVNHFNCPVCKKRNCLTCQAIHEGKDCMQFQRELAIASETDMDAKSSRLMMEEMIKSENALECPACHVLLIKKWGCDYVKCSYCKTEICWVTKGPRWGPGGKGDESGGCRCGVNGVKCSPKCTYCH